MINSRHLNELNKLGIGADINKLEKSVDLMQKASLDGKDINLNEYNKSYELLKLFKKSSRILKNDCKKADTSSYMFDNLKVCKDMIDVENFLYSILKDEYKIEVCSSLKVKGYACKLHYVDGNLIEATTKSGRNITNIMQKLIQVDTDFLNGDTIDIYGEVYGLDTKLSEIYRNKEEYLTDLLNSGISINSLKFIAFRYKAKRDYDIYETLKDELEQLANMGFDVPVYEIDEISSENDIENIIYNLEKKYTSEYFGYDTDGIVIAVNANEYDEDLDNEETDENSDIAVFKMGYWEDNEYSSEIKNIIWKQKEQDLEPTLVIEPVITVSGKTITKIELNNLNDINKNKYYIGKTINFKYNGISEIEILN